ncbi:zinc finger protein 271-like [Haliotis cracherodii]|uniref:zinc finger protein 271-like n=1 Tax=Haliotis cracherodii TaxID=6455 RepID=UPI0039ED36D6
MSSPEESYLKCDICHANFRSKEDFQNHVEQHFLNTEISRETRSESPGPSAASSGLIYICPICQEDFLSDDHLKQHEQLHQGFESLDNEELSNDDVLTEYNALQTYQHGTAGTSCGEASVQAYCDNTVLGTGEGSSMSNSEDACVNTVFGAMISEGVDSITTKPEVSQTGKRPFSCSFCDKSFLRKFDLKRHNVTHTGEHSFRCGTCGLGFLDSCGLKIHLRTHTGVKPYSCGICGKAFSRQHDVKRHSIIHAKSRIKCKCMYCNLKFNDLTQLTKHFIFAHSEDDDVACYMCDLTFKTKEEALRHVEDTHEQNETEPSLKAGLADQDEDRNDYFDCATGLNKCPICEKLFTRKTDVKRHLKTHTGHKDFICGICGVSFMDCSGLKVHLRTHTGERPFRCHVCEKSFNRGYDLKRHMTIHKDEQILSCRVCDLKCENIPSLNEHLHTHKEAIRKSQDDDDLESVSEDTDIPGDGSDPELGEQEDIPPTKMFFCHVCKTGFSRSHDLKRHVSNFHPGEYFFKCDICGSKFDNRLDLKHHMKSHSTSHVTCCLCNTNFESDNKLQTHLKFHTGENQHECIVCNNMFFNSYDLKRHMMSHTQEKPYTCSLCSCKFFAACDLKVHLRTHTGEKPYSCPVCFKAFNRKHDLKRHTVVHSKTPS